MSRSCYRALLLSGISGSELLIFAYLLEMCIQWGFSGQCEKEIADFFSTKTHSTNTYRRLAKLRSLEIIKKVSYNGEEGYMINPIYCYHGPLHLRRFRVKLWNEENLYSPSRPDRFYGPPVKNREEIEGK